MSKQQEILFTVGYIFRLKLDFDLTELELTVSDCILYALVKLLIKALHWTIGLLISGIDIFGNYCQILAEVSNSIRMLFL